jgi:hypothetical protein
MKLIVEFAGDSTTWILLEATQTERALLTYLSSVMESLEETYVSFEVYTPERFVDEYSLNHYMRLLENGTIVG